MKLTLNSLFQAVRYALDVTSYDSVFLKVKQCKILEACMLCNVLLESFRRFMGSR